LTIDVRLLNGQTAEERSAAVEQSEFNCARILTSITANYAEIGPTKLEISLRAIA
jgi:hypothetical protein